MVQSMASGNSGARIYVWCSNRYTHLRRTIVNKNNFKCRKIGKFIGLVCVTVGSIYYVWSSISPTNVLSLTKIIAWHPKNCFSFMSSPLSQHTVNTIHPSNRNHAEQYMLKTTLKPVRLYSVTWLACFSVSGRLSTYHQTV